MKGEQFDLLIEAINNHSQAIQNIANSIDRLGNADAITPMGAIEALGKVIDDGLESMSNNLSNLSDSVSEVATSINEIAGSILSTIK
jgi:hypothetical protein